MVNIQSVILELNPHDLANIIFAAALIYVSVIDIKYMIIYNKSILVLLTSDVFYNVIWGSEYSLIWGMGCSIILLFLGSMYSGGIGGGDIKLAGTIGFWLGDERSILAMMLAFWSGGIIALVILIHKGKDARKYRIPFAPFLSIGAIAAIVFGSGILSWYYQII